MKCSVCGCYLTGRQKLFCSLKCKNRAHQDYTRQRDRGRSRKLEILLERGGCGICGYDKNLAGLIFHHRGRKQFKLDIRRLANASDKTIGRELAQCQLICLVCHAEIHHPELSTKSMTKKIK